MQFADRQADTASFAEHLEALLRHYRRGNESAWRCFGAILGDIKFWRMVMVDSLFDRFLTDARHQTG